MTIDFYRQKEGDGTIDRKKENKRQTLPAWFYFKLKILTHINSG